MLSRTLFTATLFALASFTVATPPGCLLGAVNSYDDPADIKAVCSGKDVTSTIQKFCGDATKDALSAFADICNGAGVKVSTDVPKSSGSGYASATGSMTGTATGSMASATGSMTVKPSGSASGPDASSPSGTGALSPSGSRGANPTRTGGVAESTGAAGRMEVGAAAALLGLFAVVL